MTSVEEYGYLDHQDQGRHTRQLQDTQMHISKLKINGLMAIQIKRQ